MSRHDLKNEAQSEKNSPTPPTRCGQKISGLPDSNECVGGRAGSAEIGSESSALPALKQDRKDQDDAVQYEYGEKKRVKHWED
jgi:hypothetical protein